MRTAIVLFTRDLRVHDQPALAAATEAAEQVVPLFVLDRDLRAHFGAPNRIAFLLEALRDLASSLSERGGALVLRRGDVVAETMRVADETGAGAVFVSEDVSGYAQVREGRLREACEAARVDLHVSPGVTIVPPGDVAPAGSDHFRVFTPYWRRWRDAPRRRLLPAPERITLPAGLEHGTIPALAELVAGSPSPELPRGGETAGRRRLERWLDDGLAAYGRLHDDLAANATSRLSPYLHFGCLSPLEVAERAESCAGAQPFVRQLAWRDFFAQLLAANPQSATTDFRDRGDTWHDDADALAAWREGRTGYPVVDAGMRQLAREGWLHNRARLITASFLTKDLYVDWRLGAEHYFGAARRRRRRLERRQLAVGGRHRRRPQAAPDLQPDRAGQALRPERRLRAPLRPGAGRDRGRRRARAVAARAAPPAGVPGADRRPRRGGGRVPRAPSTDVLTMR